MATPQSPEKGEPRAPRLALTLADFDLIRRLGDGSYSQVVLARQKSTGKDYALKIIDKQHVIRHNAVEQVRRERNLLDKLTYDGVVELHFTFQDAISLYMGLEYCPGGELYDQIRLKGTFDVETTKFYAAEIVSILEYLRKHNVVHRDLKPENLMLTALGHLKLIDFGSAKELSCRSLSNGGGGDSDAIHQNKEEEKEENPLLIVSSNTATLTTSTDDKGGNVPTAKKCTNNNDDDDDDDIHENINNTSSSAPSNTKTTTTTTQPSSSNDTINSSIRKNASTRSVSFVGTADYVSPEILQDQPITPAADLWAFGCILYQMLTGRAPFKSNSEYLTFQKIVSLEYSPLSSSLPSSLRSLVESLLVLDPGERVGARSLDDLKCHPFFEGIHWERIFAPHNNRGLNNDTNSGRVDQDTNNDNDIIINDNDPGDLTPPEMVAVGDFESIGSAASSFEFDWELQSLAAALPNIMRGGSMERESFDFDG